MQVASFRVQTSILTDKVETLQSRLVELDKNLSSKTTGGGTSLRGTSVHDERRIGNINNSGVPQRDGLSRKHAKFGQDSHALDIDEDIRHSGVRPSSHAFVATLKACSRLKDLERVKQIHADLVGCGLESDLYIENTLIDVYAKCGSLVDARHIFERIPRRDVVSWNSLILNYAHVGKGDEALQIFARMQQGTVVPNNRTFIGVLKACISRAASEKEQIGDRILSRTGCLQQVKAIHSHMVKCESGSDMFVETMLVDVYVKCGSLLDARNVFEQMHQRDVATWNAMILGHAQMGEGEEALCLYAKMQQEGVTPNERTFVGALKACASLAAASRGRAESAGRSTKERCLNQVRAIHLQVRESGTSLEIFVGTNLVDAYSKCGSIVEAQCVFDKMRRHDVVCWNALIMGYAEVGEGEEALKLYAQMQQEGVLPDSQAYVAALKACSSLLVSGARNNSVGMHLKERCRRQLSNIHLDIRRSGLELDIFVGTMLVDVYAKCGILQEARLIFDRLPHGDVVLWNAMIWGYAQMENGEEALQLYADMQTVGAAPNDQTFLGALKACCTVAGLEKGRSIHAQVARMEYCAGNIALPNSLIHMYSKCGSMLEAQEVFDALDYKDNVTWSALIAGYAHQGDCPRVIQLLERMTHEGIQPDDVTFLSVLSACGKAGLIDKAHEYFKAITDEYGITLNLDHYTCMIDLLGRAGKVDRAIQMLNIMPFQPDAAVWESLLGACHKWCHVKLGREVFEYAVRLERSNPVFYIVMSNIYATAHMWDHAKKIQAMRVHAEAWKEQGRSWWTDKNGVVHAFVSEDQRHPQKQRIYRELRNMFINVEG